MPCIFVDQGNAVKWFDDREIISANVVELAKEYCDNGADALIVLDLSEYEDKEGQADVPLAIMPRTGEITLLQADGNLTEEEFEEALDLAMEGCRKISELQHEALKKRYSSE